MLYDLQNGTNGAADKQRHGKADIKEPAAAAVKRKSTDGAAKKPPTANGTIAAATKQKQQDSKQEKRPAAAAAKKAPAAKADKAATQAKQPRVKKEFDLPGQTRETPDEVRMFCTHMSTCQQPSPSSCIARS